MFQACSYLKSCNLAWFGWRINQRIADLQFTKQSFVEAMHSLPVAVEDCEKKCDIDALANDHEKDRSNNNYSIVNELMIDSKELSTNRNDMLGFNNKFTSCDIRITDEESLNCNDFAAGPSTITDHNRELSSDSHDGSMAMSKNEIQDSGHQTVKSEGGLKLRDNFTRCKTSGCSDQETLTSDEILRHTTIDSIAKQLLDFQRMISLIVKHLVSRCNVLF